MKVKIGGRGAYPYIRNDPPEAGSKGFDEWEENDLVVFSWIVDNIENEIVADFAHHLTSKALWDNLAVTFENKADRYLIYDLEEKAINIKQGSLNLETYYRRIHGLWINIDQYDSIRRDILKEDPPPSVETAYGRVKTEAARRSIMPPTSPSPTGEANGGNADSSFGGEIGHGLATIGQEWWEERQRARSAQAKLAVGVNEDGTPRRADTGVQGELNGPVTGTRQENQSTGGNIRGAGNFAERAGGSGGVTAYGDRNDFIMFNDVTKLYIKTANGELITVEGSDTIEISPTLRLTNCLYVPTLSQRLMPISHDIQTRRILGRGTEKQGLYYVDEIAQHGSAMLAHGSTKQETWLWHRRLGHPSPVKGREVQIILIPDYLSWVVPLPSSSIEDPTDPVVVTATEQVSPTIEPPPHPPLSNQPPTISEVISEPNTVESSVIPDPVDTEPREENNALDGDTGKYVLPYRRTRGIPPKRYSPEKIGKKSRYGVANFVQGNLTKMARAFEVALYEEEEIPQSAEEAMKHKNWREAMLTEMRALMKNNTWVKSKLPGGVKTVGCRWVFTIKRRPDGTVERYKARFVAKGYTQTYGVDYAETFSPVAKINTVRVLFSIAANKDWPLHQFDVTNAFLHGELPKPVFMEPPSGFTGEFRDGEVCQLKKTLYGLKRSPRAWFGRFK
ncbi:uncharacterized protein LOC125220919 [Salvia hispanica]|uniref:uncharacterized protein LOC125220919 n=1 Tax=Salvia hispanica TaxID=49212 RepID=UPI002009BF44|nr:uncharacterized protein LOC125220919 [Salvia hispanica]